MIPQRNISLLANRLAREGERRLREDVLERDYCLAWFLSTLAETELKEALAFKGGTALKRCYFNDYRFSEDLDFTLVKPIPFEELLHQLEPVYARVREASGITFAFGREDRQKHRNTYTFYLTYVGPLPAGNDVKVDITVQEQLVFPLQEKTILRGYDEFADLPENRSLQVYSLEEIASEKILALADRARNEPRDFYDLWHLTQNAGIELGPLVDSVQKKLTFRGKPCEGIAEAIQRKEGRLKALWSGRLSYQTTTLPEFDGIFRALRREIRRAQFP